MQNELLSIVCEENTFEMPKVVAQNNLVELEGLDKNEYEAILKYTKALQNQNEKIELNHQELNSKVNAINIPTKNSQLENDSNFITTKEIPVVPSALSEFENDCNFTTSENIEELVSDKANIHLNNITKAAQTTVYNWGMPDYSKAFNIIPVLNVDYVIPMDSYFFIKAYGGGQNFAYFTISKTVFSGTTFTSYGSGHSAVLLNKNDTMRVTAAGGTQEYVLVPLKGAV